MKLWALVLVACGGAKPPAPTANEQPPRDFSRIPPYATVYTSAFRPTIDLTAYTKPDLAADERWPLSSASHPEFEPHFDVAAALAQPGITWTDLCNRGIQNRHLSRDQDLVEYLQAWCTAAQHDVSAALYQLGKLRSSPVRGLREALSFDAVDMLADHGSADDVENLLLHAGLLDLDIVDRLAAAYLEAGRLPDAYEINVLATHLDRTPNDANVCRRLVRAMAAGTADERGDARNALRGLVAPVHPDKLVATSDPTCRRLWKAVACLADDDCHAYWRDFTGLSIAQIELFEVYHSWPTGGVNTVEWVTVAQHAAEGVPLDNAYRLAIPALELSLRSSRCFPSALEVIAKAVDVLATSPHDPQFDVPLKALAAATHDLDHVPYEHCQERINALPPVVP